MDTLNSMDAEWFERQARFDKMPTALVLDELACLLEAGVAESAIDCHIGHLHNERRLKLICNEMLMVAR